jgi:phosphoglucomutase
MAKTIVTTELVADIYKNHDLRYFDVLTGFKFIADMIHKYENELTFIGGGEESYGFMIGDFVRDKDAVTTCSMIAEIAAWAREQGKSLFDLLLDIYQEYAFYKESLVSVYRHGKEGAEEIAVMMENFRSTPPTEIDGSKVVMIKDFLLQKTFDQVSGQEEPTGLPKSNVLQFLTENGTKVSVRPSGTEPKIKFYFSVRSALHSREEYEVADAALSERIEAIKEELKLNDQ